MISLNSLSVLMPFHKFCKYFPHSCWSWFEFKWHSSYRFACFIIVKCERKKSFWKFSFQEDFSFLMVECKPIETTFVWFHSFSIFTMNFHRESANLSFLLNWLWQWTWRLKSDKSHNTEGYKCPKNSVIWSVAEEKLVH